MNALLFAAREIRHAPRFAVLFVLAIGLGTSVLAAFSGLSSALERSLDERAREIAAADIRIEADENSILSLEENALRAWPGARSAKTTELLTMARRIADGEVQQAALVAVDTAYPLHGSVHTRDGRSLGEAVGSGRLLVEERFLALAGLTEGDSVLLGDTAFVIAGVVGRRTDVAVSFFRIAPSVFIARADLDRTGLLAPGSRARHRLFLNLPEHVDLDQALAALKDRAADATASVESWRDEGAGVTRFLRNTVFFLSVTGLLTLALGGVTGAAVLIALLHRSAPALAAARAIGAPPSFPVRVFAGWILILSLLAGFVAAGGGLLVGRAVASGLGDLLPDGLVPDEGAALFLRIVASVILVAFVFSSGALARLARLPPHAALRGETALPARAGRAQRLLLGLSAGAALLLLVRLHVGGFALAAWGLAAWTGAIAVAWVVAALLLALGLRASSLSGFTVARLAAREARHGFAYRSLAVAFLGLSASVILSILLLRHNVTSEFVRAAPRGSPNVFFMNLRPGEENSFREAAEAPQTRFYPLIRGRIVSVDGVRTAEIQDAHEDAFGSGDRLTREFGLTYGDSLLPTDRISGGGELWDDAVPGPQVSVFEEFRDRFGIRQGSLIVVNILGRTVAATVTSFRSINRTAREPFFYFQFRPGLVDTFPQTLMGGMNLERARIPETERRIARLLPHVTLFDLADVAEQVELLLDRLHRAVNVVAAAALGGGLLLLVSGVLVNLAEIRREAVLFRAIGASPRRVLAVFLLEHLGSGVAASIAAGAVSLALTWAVMHHGLGSDWDPWWTGTLPFLALFTVVTALSGLAASALTLSVRPMEVLRHE